MRRYSKRRWIGGIVLCLVGMGLGGFPTDLWGQATASGPRSVRKVIGTDERQYVSDTTAFPWSATGLVEANFADGTYMGTGAMIGKKVAVTCAHVVYDPIQKGSRDIYFIPGKNGDTEPFGRFRVVTMMVMDAWARNVDNDYDIALLVLDTPAGSTTGSFKFTVEPDGFFGGQTLYSTGYPSDLGGCLYQYSCSGQATGTVNNIILDTFDSAPGQSGSPVWLGDVSAGTGRLVGLLKGYRIMSDGTRLIENGQATQINTTIASWINQQLARYDNDILPPAGEDSDNKSVPSVKMTGTGFCGTGADQVLLFGVLSWSSFRGAARGRRR
jgi:V8-like Glu-specific endopeptidase